MARIECRSAQDGVESVWVEVDGISDDEVIAAREALDRFLTTETQVSTAVARAFEGVVTMCPEANPSDLWQHVIYRHLLDLKWSDNRWKRVSGYALERVLVSIYEPRLAAYDLRMRILSQAEATQYFVANDLDIKASKVDLFIEGKLPSNNWLIFGAAHVKSSIAERIQDDAPASRKLMDAGLISIALTMDAKSYPPPHGPCINFGELGGRSEGVEKERIKRDYVERSGQFDALFSFNLRTPASAGDTPSGKRIFRLGLADAQPDALVQFLTEAWRSRNP